MVIIDHKLTSEHRIEKIIEWIPEAEATRQASDCEQVIFSSPNLYFKDVKSDEFIQPTTDTSMVKKLCLSCFKTTILHFYYQLK